VDKPDSLRKIHTKPIPVGGGVVLFLTTVVVFFVCGGFASKGFHSLINAKIILPLFLTSGFIVAVGLADDKWELSGKIKLFSQVIVATILIIFAGEYSTISFFGTQYHLGHLFYPLGILWFVGLINAINFLDGADGVCSTAGLLMSLTAAVLAMITGQTAIVLTAVIFAGALLGFLFCNFPPAKVYLGDTGSMLIGLVVGTLLLRSCTVENRVINIVPPLAVVTIPIFDLVLSFFRRISSGRGLFSPDRGHIHHRLLVRLKNIRIVLLYFALFFTLCGTAAVVSLKYQNDWAAVGVMILLPCGMILTRLFGWEEMNVLIGQIVNRFAKHWNKTNYGKTGEVFCYQGNGPWKELWMKIVTFLKQYHCVKAYLDINIPSHHENYIAKWKFQDKSHHDDFIFLNICLPFLEHDRKVGALDMYFDPRWISVKEILEIAPQLENICVSYITDYMRQVDHHHFSPETFNPEIYFLRFDFLPMSRSQGGKNANEETSHIPIKVKPRRL
jgi:UDP-GlcNAc:undecaprenyl-phosphate GlcNAc-1-phosphate transferase